MTASMIATLVSLVPFPRDESPRIVELCSSDGRLAEALLTHFPHATLAALFHHLAWLKHAGFAAVDCFRVEEGQAVFGGFKQAAGSAAPLPAGS